MQRSRQFNIETTAREYLPWKSCLWRGAGGLETLFIHTLFRLLPTPISLTSAEHYIKFNTAKYRDLCVILKKA